MSSSSIPPRPASPAMPPQRPAKRQPTIRSQTPQTSSPLASTSSTSLSAPSQTQPIHSSPLASTPIPAGPSRDPAIDRALQLSTFESGYSPESFISTLSTSLISTSKSSAGPFDPSPFLQVFSPALDSLLKLRGEVAERTKKMETDVRRAEREYGRRLRELDGGFEAIGSSFESLEERITDVGRTAVRIGEQLEGLHQTRSTAQSTSLIVSYYLSLTHSAGTTATTDGGDQSNMDGMDGDGEGKKSGGPLEALFATRTSREGRAKLAVILRRLMAVAKDMADNSALAALEAESQLTPNPSASPNAGEEGKPAVVDQRTLGRRRREKEKAERVRDEVERYCERFEKEVLRLFDRSYRKGDPRMMAHCAKTLQDFNGGASCVQIYVNQHDFFISHGKVVEDAERSLEEEGDDGVKRVDIWKTIGNPDASPPTNEPGLDALIREIKITTSQEAQIVKAVFPNPVAVATVFIQRVFAQVLQQHIESLVIRAQSISTLAVLRILNLCHSNCSTLVDDLRSYDLALSTGSNNASGPSTPTAGTGPSAPTKGAGAGGPLSNMLDHALEEMFVPWLEGNRYLESESKNLVELYGGLLSRFTRYHETVMKAKPNSLLDKVVNQLSSSSPSGQTTSTSTAQSAAAAISKYANLFTASAAQAVKSAANANMHASAGMGGMAYIPPQSHTSGVTSPTDRKTPLPPHLTLMTNGIGNSANGPASPGGISSPVIPSPNPGAKQQDPIRGAVSEVIEDRPSKVDGGLSMLAAERMLRWHAEAVGRVVEMSQAGDVGRNAFALSKVLAEAIGRGYIEIALDSAAARLDQHDNKTEVDFESLLVLRPADQICHLWQRYTSTALFPLAGGTQAGSNTRREMGTYNSHGLVRLEGKVNTVIHKTIDAIITAIRQLLTRQKKNDYKPLNDEISFARNQTEPCELCCQLMDEMRTKARESMSGKNLDAFFTEVGVAIHSLLLDHYKRFPVNPTGGLMLTKDLAAYQESAAGLGIPAVNDRFDMLRQLGNSFIVQPNVLKSYMTESHLGRIELKLLRPYLQQRVDYSSFAKSLNLEEGPGPLSLESDRERKMNNRLSAISGVAGAGMGKLKGLLKELEVGLTPEEEAAMRKANAQRIGYTQGSGRYLPPVYMGMH